MHKDSTIIDVSKLAGVSIATVSRVINKSGYVSEQAVRKVEHAIKELSFQSNALATGLKTGKTGVIGLVVPKIQLFFMQVLEALEFNIPESEYSILVATTNNNPEQEMCVIERLLGYKVDGLIVASSNTDGSYFEKINRRKCPVVLIDRELEDVKVDMVIEENEKTAYELTKKLLEANHKKILVISGLTHLSIMRQRLQGSQIALSEHGIPHEKQMILDGRNNILNTRQCFIDYISSASPENYPTAIVSLNPRMTEGVMLGIKDLGMKIPQDFSLSSYGELNSELISPRLTCVIQNGARIGESAAQLLLKRINKDDSLSEFEKVVFKNDILEGNSIRKA